MSKLLSLVLSVSFGASALAISSLAAHAEIAAPTGEVIPTIDGSVTGGEVSADLAAIEALPAETFETTTIWTDGTLKFTGVPLKALVEAAGGQGSVVVAEALNGYAVEIPVSVLEDKAPIVAYKIDDQPFSRRDKGPLWVVFPYDLDEKYKSETTYSYSIWQLHRLTVK